MYELFIQINATFYTQINGKVMSTFIVVLPVLYYFIDDKVILLWFLAE